MEFYLLLVCFRILLFACFYLSNELNVTGGYDTAVTVRTRIGWMKFRECGELLQGKIFLLKIKGLQELCKISYFA